MRASTVLQSPAEKRVLVCVSGRWALVSGRSYCGPCGSFLWKNSRKQVESPHGKKLSLVEHLEVTVAVPMKNLRHIWSLH